MHDSPTLLIRLACEHLTSAKVIRPAPEQIEEPPQRLRVAAGSGPQQRTRIVIDDDGDVPVPRADVSGRGRRTSGGLSVRHHIGCLEPPEIMSQLCARLDELTSPQMRAAVELAIDTGRRPVEICALDFDCLTRDDDGLPVLIYDNHKANRLARRLPIGEQTAAVIVAAQQRVRAHFPQTPISELTLLPTDRRSPGRRHAITAFSLAFAHRTWVDRMPALRTADGVEYDKSKIVLHAYRHSYAQRHADAGVPVSDYYRVGRTRPREAVDRVTAMQFDRHGNRI